MQTQMLNIRSLFLCPPPPLHSRLSIFFHSTTKTHTLSYSDFSRRLDCSAWAKVSVNLFKFNSTRNVEAFPHWTRFITSPPQLANLPHFPFFSESHSEKLAARKIPSPARALRGKTEKTIQIYRNKLPTNLPIWSEIFCAVYLLVFPPPSTHSFEHNFHLLFAVFSVISLALLLFIFSNVPRAHRSLPSTRENEYWRV